MHNDNSFMTENFGYLAHEGITLMRHHTYIYCSPTRRAPHPCSRPPAGSARWDSGSGALTLWSRRIVPLRALPRSHHRHPGVPTPTFRTATAAVSPSRTGVPISLNDPRAGVRAATGPDVL